jgi:DNA modification methylase
MERNKVHLMNWLDNTLPDKSVQLIIADPPYFEVKGEFDFIWSSFDEYLKDVEKWAKECERLLADNGTLFWWGDDKKIAYAQIIFDKYLSIINHIVWHKGEDFMGLNKSEGLRSFAPCSERILMYSSKEQDATGLQYVEKKYVAPRNPFAIELKKARLKKDVSIKDVAEYGKFYGNVNHGGSVTNWEKGYSIPLKKQWQTLCEFLPIERDEYEDLRREYEDLRREYEDLRREYEDLRRPFNNVYNLNEVMRFNNEAAMNTQYKHPTRKPEKLTRALILTCSKPNDLILVPFAGSGTECAMAAREGREFIGFDIEAKYVDMANKRAKRELSTPKLF